MPRRSTTAIVPTSVAPSVAPITEDQVKHLVHDVSSKFYGHYLAYLQNMMATASVFLAIFLAITAYYSLSVIQKKAADEAVILLKNDLKFHEDLGSKIIPSGSVMGMSLENIDNRGEPSCPRGWWYLSAAEGRLPIGGQPKVDGDTRTGALGFVLGGGIKQVKKPGSVVDNRESLSEILPSQNQMFKLGAGTPEIGVGPFIAMYFCVKS